MVGALRSDFRDFFVETITERIAGQILCLDAFDEVLMLKIDGSLARIVDGEIDILFLAGLVYGLSLITETKLTILVIVFYVVVVLIFLPIMFIFFEMNSVYKATFKMKLKNSFLIYTRTFPFAILCVIIFLAPFSLLLIGSDLAILLTLFLYFVFYFPIGYLGLNLFLLKIFDKYINIRFYPEIVDLGIWRK